VFTPEKEENTSDYVEASQYRLRYTPFSGVNTLLYSEANHNKVAHAAEESSDAHLAVGGPVVGFP
jgi:hypothetical protein